jgi:hypothetical protein
LARSPQLLLLLALGVAVGLLVICSHVDAFAAAAKSGDQEGGLLMLGFMLSQLALRLFSALLGGYGIFSLILSFEVQEAGARAFILLITATAIVYMCRSERTR